MSHERIQSCRLCGWPSLTSVLDLGEMAFTGMFPKPGVEVPRGPLELLECDACGLAQIAHAYSPEVLYGNSYGYRSGLNPSMVAHLKELATEAWQIAKPERGDVVLDIGANDGTLLGFFPSTVNRIAYDPLAEKYAKHYDRGIVRHAELFTEASVDVVGRDRASIVMTIACFYDLPDPVGFARAVWAILKNGGIWVIEIATADNIWNGAWDQICHEHQEFYGIEQLRDICDRAGFSVVNVFDDDVNGGSTRLIAAKESAREWYPSPFSESRAILPVRWAETRETIDRQCAALKAYLEAEKKRGRIVWGYGASTKGNVVLQRAGIGPELLPCIVDANPDKDGCVTPGTGIPIVTEATSRWIGAGEPNAFLVLPWHFREFVIQKEHTFLDTGGELIFALPKLEVVTKDGVREVAA